MSSLYGLGGYRPKSLVKGKWVIDFKETPVGAFSLILVDEVPSWRFRDGRHTTIDAPYDDFDSIEEFEEHINERYRYSER